MISLSQAQIDAAQAFANAAISELGTVRGVHAETAVASVARMAGTFLFRSQQTNEAGPRLIQVFAGALAEIGIALDETKLGATQLQANQPKLGFLETQKLLEPLYLAIRARHGLSDLEAADAGAVATAFVVHQCSTVLNPSVAFGVAVYGFIEGSRTAPAPVVH